MRSELIIPDSAVEMTYSDMCLVNGGGTISLTITTGIFGNALGMIVGSLARNAAINVILTAWITGQFAAAGLPFAGPTLGTVPALLAIAGAIVAGILISKLIDLGVDAFLSWADARPTLWSGSASFFLLPNWKINL